MPSNMQARRADASGVAAALLLLLAAGAAALLPGRLAAQPADLPALAGLEAQGAAVAGLVVDLERGAVLAARAPDAALIPASVVKLATAGLALETFGPTHRFETLLLRRGPLVDGVLQGDLVLRGGGDPTVTDQDFWRLARSLAQRGVSRVVGDLIVDEGLFGRLPCGVEDRCEAEAGSENAYDAALSATPVDHNAVALTVAAAERPGVAARLIPQPFPLPGIAVEGEVATGDGPARLALHRSGGQGGQRLTVAGELPPGRSLTLYRSLAEPALHAGRLFRAFLAREGIAVEGVVRVAYEAVAGAEPLVAQQGETLARAVGLMLAFSNNLIADVLALDLQQALQPDAPADLRAAGALIAGHAAAAAEGSAFPAPAAAPAPLLRDGSGLDPADRLTARQLVQLLERGYRRAASFPSLLAGLTVPAHGQQRSLPAPPDGVGAAEWDERTMVKTGGLSEPVSVTSLAGYFRFRDGGWGAFAFLVNGAPGRAISRAEAFSAMRRDLDSHWTRS